MLRYLKAYMPLIICPQCVMILFLYFHHHFGVGVILTGLGRDERKVANVHKIKIGSICCRIQQSHLQQKLPFLSWKRVLSCWWEILSSSKKLTTCLLYLYSVEFMRSTGNSSWMASTTPTFEDPWVFLDNSAWWLKSPFEDPCVWNNDNNVFIIPTIVVRSSIVMITCVMYPPR